MIRLRTVSTKNLLRSSVYCDFINENIRSQFALCPGITKKIDYFKNFRESINHVSKMSIKKAQILSLPFFGKNQCL